MITKLSSATGEEATSTSVLIYHHTHCSHDGSQLVQPGTLGFMHVALDGDSSVAIIIHHPGTLAKNRIADSVPGSSGLRLCSYTLRWHVVGHHE